MYLNAKEISHWISWLKAGYGRIDQITMDEQNANPPTRFKCHLGIHNYQYYVVRTVSPKIVTPQSLWTKLTLTENYGSDRRFWRFFKWKTDS